MNELAECGYCGVTPPDEFGQRDLLVSRDCPYHGDGPVEKAETVEIPRRRVDERKAA